MNKKNTSEHLDDIDFRSREERQKDAPDIFIEWYKSLADNLKDDGFSEFIYGQYSMLGHVLWYSLPPKQYDALKNGREYIDLASLSEDQLALYRSFSAFGGSPKCNRKSKQAIVHSYIERMKHISRPHMATLAKQNPDLTGKISNNIYVEFNNA